jgi:sulfur-oxidizing protein SoxX
MALADQDRIAQGKEIAFDRKAGNCLACHMMDDGQLPGNIGPPLIAMKQRFPDFDALKQQVSNPLLKNPNSMMPPFGLHNILSEDELQLVVEYIHTL